ncbi:rRNA pseudouridine synthase [Aeromicrobium sp.]|nr:rRNA pseudouridine synthase [Candidatus Saccharibacteria bacterium]
MRINKYIALASDLSRRGADAAIEQGRVLVNGQLPDAGQSIVSSDTVTLDKRALTPAVKTTIMFNKPVSYVCSRNGQGSQTIFDLLSPDYWHLQTVGRLDKYSSGLLLLTNDGDLANELTHPSREKQKVYQVVLKEPLQPLHRQMIQDHGILLDDGASKFELSRRKDGDDRDWQVTMHEGRNRQIRRTFQSLGYEVLSLHRTSFGAYTLGDLKTGELTIL